MKLPDPDIQTGPWEQVREGVQRNLDALARAGAGFGGQSVEIRFGTDTVTFTASNFSDTPAINHGLGRVPVGVVATCVGNGVNYGTSAYTATTFTVQGDYPYAALTGSNPFVWIAIG